MPDRAIAAGLADPQWPGRPRVRVRRLPGGRELLLDAAHNPAGAASLASYLKAEAGKPRPLVLAAMRDKDISGIFAALLPAVGRLIVTRASNARSADPELLAQQARAIAPTLPIAVEPALDAALDAAWHASPRIVVAGSILPALGDAVNEAGRRVVIPFEGLRSVFRMLKFFRLCACVSCGLWAASAYAQAPQTPVTDTTISDSREGSNNQKDWHFIGHVEMDRPGSDTKIYADDVMMYTGTNKAIATGNVVLAQGDNRISAEHAEFDTKTGLGTFFNATGFSTVKPPKPQPARAGGIAPPPVVGQDTVVIFFGEKIEKIAPKKYKITNGGFSTCMQPTPRWDLHAGTVLLNVDHYTVLTNAVLRVKGVPMFYTPFLYYPTKREDRATGFLLPTYGSSTIRGQSIHNGFFWAIDRSQDATILHDWFSKTGQGLGTEYRYNVGNGDGNIRAYIDDQHAATYTLDDGTTSGTPASRSYDIRGAATQLLPFGLRARANVNYFSSIQQSQAFNTNIYDASRNSRSFGGNVVGAWGKYSLNATLDHTEYFYNLTDSVLSGSWPRVALTRNERPIGDSPAYFSIGTEFVSSLRSRTAEITNDNGTKSITSEDTGLTRIDVAPQVRYPFKKWQWFTVNTTVGWRETYYSRSYEPTDDPKVPPFKLVDVGLNRTLYTITAQDGRPGVQPGVGNAGERLRREVQAYDRAGPDRRTAPRRSTTSTRSSSWTASINYVGGTTT